MIEDDAYVAVATVAPLDATTTLFFTHVADRVPLRFVQPATSGMANPLKTLRTELAAANPLAGAAAIIVVRGLFELENLIGIARWMGIPCYYFTDDNFMILRDEMSLGDPGHARAYSRDRVRAALEGFSGVLLSTGALVDFFQTHHLHDSLSLYPPVQGPPIDVTRTSDDGRLKIAFFGGQQRREPFERWVLPAICRLSETRAVTLYAAGMALGGMSIPGDLRIVPIAYNPSYPQALRDMASNGIDVLVHPSSDTRNNEFKNCHFLINANALGAAAIFSDVAPYAALSGENLCLLCENSEPAWYSALSRLAGNPALRTQLTARSAGYCAQHFNGAANVQVVRTILRNHPSPTVASRRARAIPIMFRLAGGLARDVAVRQLQRISTSPDRAERS
jgi:hypothetical protein